MTSFFIIFSKIAAIWKHFVFFFLLTFLLSWPTFLCLLYSVRVVGYNKLWWSWTAKVVLFQRRRNRRRAEENNANTVGSLSLGSYTKCESQERNVVRRKKKIETAVKISRFRIYENSMAGLGLPFFSLSPFFPRFF